MKAQEWGRAALLWGLGSLLACSSSPIVDDDSSAEGDLPDPSLWTPSSGAVLWESPPFVDVPLPPSLEDGTFLRELSEWGQVWQAPAPRPGRGESGSFGLGNGQAFALLGLDDPWNTLTNLIGPGYQREDSFFGDISLEFIEEGKSIPATMEQVRRARDSHLVLSRWEGKGVAATLVDGAVPGEAALLRHLSITVGEAKNVEGVVGLTRAEGEPPDAYATTLYQQRGRRWMAVGCSKGAALEGDRLVFHLSKKTSQPFETTCVTAFGFTKEEAMETRNRVLKQNPKTLFTEAHQADADFLSQGISLSLPDPRVADLVMGMLLTHRVQTTPEGLVSPMSRYTSGWLRDGEGTVRLCLRAAQHDAVRGLLDATITALIHDESISNSFSLEDAEGAPSLPGDPESFWNSVPFMEGRNPVEAPSYPVLLHRMVQLETGDETWMDDNKEAFLTACILRQQASDEGLYAFSGDETFRYPMAFSMGGVLAEDLGWSANSSFLLVSACDSLNQWLMEAGRENPQIDLLCQQGRALAEESFWVESAPSGGRHPGKTGYYAPLVAYGSLEPHPSPYEDISAQPLWTGYLDSADLRGQENLESLLEFAWREDGVLLSPLEDSGEAPFFTGMVPGFLLANLSRVHHPEEERAFTSLSQVATPSGHFEEILTAQGEVLNLGHQQDGTGSDASARYRPWEGGIVVAALLEYLWGDSPRPALATLTLAPHLPQGWDGARADHLAMGEERYSLEVRGYQEGQVIQVVRNESPPESEPWMVELTAHLRRSVAGVFRDGQAVPFSGVDSLWGGAGQVVRIPGLSLSPGEGMEIWIAAEGTR